MQDMKITTKTGSVYKIKNNVCYKHDKDGELLDVFKVFVTKAIHVDFEGTMGDVYNMPNSEPEVGKLLYIAGKEGWWLSTSVVSIDLNDTNKKEWFDDDANESQGQESFRKGS
jgi:hypothetical protein